MKQETQKSETKKQEHSDANATNKSSKSILDSVIINNETTQLSKEPLSKSDLQLYKDTKTIEINNDIDDFYDSKLEHKNEKNLSKNELLQKIKLLYDHGNNKLNKNQKIKAISLFIFGFLILIGISVLISIGIIDKR